jgi:hypothetical protein
MLLSILIERATRHNQSIAALVTSGDDGIRRASLMQRTSAARHGFETG